MTVLDELVPEPLHRWDAAVLARLRSEGKSENVFFEFKATFDGAEVEKTVCAFANRMGGYLLFGATADPDNRLKAFPGLESGKDWPKLVSDWVVGHISPLPAWDAVSVDSPDRPGRPVVVVRVEESTSTPHIVTSSGTIYRREPAGSYPVKDGATLDVLIRGGVSGTDYARSRADKVHGAHWGAQDGWPPSAWVVRVALVPMPAVGPAALAGLLTRAGMAGAAEVFTEEGWRDLRPLRLAEDHVMFVGGYAIGARYTDGTLFAARAWPTSYVGAESIYVCAAHLLAAAGAQAGVHQVLMDLRLWGADKLYLTPTITGGSGHPAGPIAQSPWEWSRNRGNLTR